LNPPNALDGGQAANSLTDMADMELVTFETAVEKLCADWTLDVAKLLNDAGEAVAKRSDVLRGKIKSLPVPQKSDEKEISQLPARINEILGQESVRLKGLIEMKLVIKIDVKARRLTIDGSEMRGAITALRR